MDNKIQTRVYSITCKKEELDILETLFKEMQTMGAVGASRAMKLYVDGDGAFRPKFKKLIIEDNSAVYEEDLNTLLLANNKDIDHITHGYGVVARNCDEFKGDGYFIYYDFG